MCIQLQNTPASKKQAFRLKLVPNDGWITVLFPTGVLAHVYNPMLCYFKDDVFDSSGAGNRIATDISHERVLTSDAMSFALVGSSVDSIDVHAVMDFKRLQADEVARCKLDVELSLIHI